MLDQTKIGTFIAERRKSAGLTQKELAERLSLSDKTVSKWETGHGMPDNSLLLELCRILDISVNELLSGEKLSDDSYERKAEENMVNLVKENQDKSRLGKDGRITTVIFTILGILLILLYITSMVGIVQTWWIANFIDLPSLFMTLGIIFLMLALTKQIKPFFAGFGRAVGKADYGEGGDDAAKDTHTRAVKQSKEAMHFVRNVSLLSGALGFFFSVVILIHLMSDPSALGPSLAVAILTPLYSIVLNLILLPFESLLNQKSEA